MRCSRIFGVLPSSEKFWSFLEVTMRFLKGWTEGLSKNEGHRYSLRILVGRKNVLLDVGSIPHGHVAWLVMSEN